MSEIHNVAILGAGAMGAYFAAQFYAAPGLSTRLIADDQRLEKLNKDGIVVNGKPYLIPAISPDAAEAPADLIIVGLKHHQLRGAIQNLGKLVGENTTFISVMNGLESEEIIGSVYGMDKMLYAVSVGIDAVREGNRVSFSAPGTHVFGEAENKIISPKVRRVQAAFDAAGIHYETPVDMIRKMWWKFMINVGINQASAVTRSCYAVFQSNGEAQALMEALMQEVVTLAVASKVDLTQEDLKNWYPVLNTLSPQGKTSMLQDVEARRKTEVEVFGGKVVSLGKNLHIPTPVNQAVVQIIHVLEQNY